MRSNWNAEVQTWWNISEGKMYHVLGKFHDYLVRIFLPAWEIKINLNYVAGKWHKCASQKALRTTRNLTYFLVHISSEEHKSRIVCTHPHKSLYFYQLLKHACYNHRQVYQTSRPPKGLNLCDYQRSEIIDAVRRWQCIKPCDITKVSRPHEMNFLRIKMIQLA